MRSEGDIGRYLLSGATALLVLLAAVSYIALVWGSMANMAKVGLLGAIAVGTTSVGTVLARRATRLRVAAATLTGTGGALGFVAIIGAVLLDTGTPVLLAFCLMAVWSIILLITAKVTRQIFTAVISSLGALVTIGFAAWHVSTHPEMAALTWILVHLDVIALALVAARLGRSSASMRLAPWFPVTAVPVTLAALLLSPAHALIEVPEAVCVLVVFVPVIVMIAQVLDAGPRLHEAGWAWTAGADWGLVGMMILVAQLRVIDLQTHPTGAGYHGPFVLAGAAGALLLVVTASGALLVISAPEAWRFTVAPVHLTTAVLVGVVVCSAESRLFPLTVLMLVIAAVPHALHCGPAPVTVIAAAGPVALTVLSRGSAADTLCALTGALAIPAGVIALERIRVRTTGSDTASPDSRGRDRQRDESHLVWSCWLLAVDLIVVVPILVSQLRPGSPSAPALGVIVSGLIAIALALLGLFSDSPTPTALLTGALVGRRAGAHGSRAVILDPSPPAWCGYAVLAVLALTQLLTAMALESTLWRGLLVLVALGAGTTAMWLLAPWTYRVGEAIAAAGLMSVLIWWSAKVLAENHMTGAVMTAVMLTTGAICIIAGFRLRTKILRHYGLVVVLASVVKLALIDIGDQNSLTRILALMLAGLVCFGLSLAYNRIAADDEAGTAGDADGGAGPDHTAPSGPPRGTSTVTQHETQHGH